MDLQLTGQKVLVTASSGGIGQAIATTFASEGAIVLINGRSETSVQQAIEQIQTDVPNAQLIAVVGDAGTAEGCAAIIKQQPEIDVLVNNLGIYEAADFFEITDEQWLRIYEVNILSGVRLARHYLKQMLDQNQGRIIFISSESAINPAPEMAHYSMTKTAQLAISRGLAELTRGTQVTVNTVMPGSTRTESVQKFVQGLFPDEEYAAAEKRFMQENRPTSLIERLIEPQEIAQLVVLVASPTASAINGAALRADGGIVRSIF